MGGCGGARGRIIRCGRVSRNRQVSGNGGMGRSSQVIGGASGSNWANWTGAEGWTVEEG